MRTRCSSGCAVLACLMCFVSCGSQSSVPDEAQKVAAFVALARKACRELPSSATYASDTAMMRSRLREDAHVPRLRKFISDHAALQAQERAITHSSTRPLTGQRLRSALTRVYALSLPVYNDAKALGISACAPRRPRPN